MLNRQSIKRRLVRSCKRVLAQCTKAIPPSGVRVLGYHSISKGTSPLCVTPDEFESHLRYLASNGYTTLSISEFSRRITDNLPGKREVLITFDDGYVDFLANAVPLLQRYGCRATVFVVPELAGGSPTWLERDVDLINMMLDTIRFSAAERNEVLRWNKEFSSTPLMNWDQLRQLPPLGVDVQSHSWAHHFLTKLPDDQLANDLSSARTRIERELGHSVISIAYPYGDADDRVAQIARQSGYQLGLLSNIATKTDPLQISRTQIGGEHIAETFRYCISAASSFEMACRLVLHRLRNQLGSNHGT